MKRSTFLAISAFIAIIFGLVMFIMPGRASGMYSIAMSEGAKAMERYLGAFLVSIGIMNWIARKADDSLALRAILYGNLAVHALTLVTDLLAITSGAVTSQAWGSAVLHVVFGAGFAYYAFAKPKVV